MDIIKFSDHLRKVLKQKQTDVSLYVSQGVKDWDQYNNMVGKYHAYNEMLTEINSLLKRMELDDGDINN
jgi:hypothetical protein